MMQTLAIFSALAAYLCTCYADPQAILVDNKDKAGVQVVKMEAGEHFKAGDKSVKTKMLPNSDIESAFYCTEESGKQLTASPDGDYVGCCLPTQVLLGSEKTQFSCCGKGHILAGDKDVGYSCCPEGSFFDGKLCKEQERKNHCKNGKELVDGKCVCPKATEETAEGTCKPAQCSSDISYGKCYMFMMDTGYYLGADSGTYYYTGPKWNNAGVGVFSFCKDDKCDSTGPVGANDSLLIRDNRGHPPTGASPGWFLGNDANGNHMAKRNNPALYGKFSISKFPECGKYCLGGWEWGLWYACPAQYPGLTFWPQDKKTCLTIELVEVNCDFHEDKSNCNWPAHCNKNKLSGPPTPHHMEL